MSPFDKIIELFNQAIPQWEAVGISLAKELFILLVVIQICYSGILWMLNRNEPNTLLIEFVTKMLSLLFFWAIIDNYQIWIPAIVDGMRMVAERMTGIETLSPGDVMQRGIDIATRMMTAAKHHGLIQHIFGSILASLIGATVFFCFTRIGVEIFLVILGARIILAGGIIFLAFAGTTWSRQFTERYLTAVVAIGTRMLFLTLIIGIAETLTPEWSEMLKTATPDRLFETYLAILAGTLTYYYLAMRIPDMAVTLLTGAFNLNFSGGIVPTVAAAGAYGLGMAGIAAGKLGAGIVGGGAAITEAIKTGFSAAKASGATGGNFVKQAATATLGKLAEATSQHFKDSVGSSISKTTGGQIANQLRTLSAADDTKKQQPKEQK